MAAAAAVQTGGSLDEGEERRRSSPVRICTTATLYHRTNLLTGTSSTGAAVHP